MTTIYVPVPVTERLPEEIWGDIPQWEGLYQVSNIGRIRSLSRIIKDKKGRTLGFSGKIISAPLNQYGYPHVCLRKRPRQSSFLVHRT